MFKLLVLSSLVAVALANSDLTVGLGSFSKGHPKFPGPKIVGGDKAEEGQFPYQVSLQLKGGLAGGHFCGGSIISAKTILTAGHCVTEVNIGILQHIEVNAGLISLSEPGENVQTSKISKTIVNPDFPGGVAANDVAIHILATALKLNDFVNVVLLPAPLSEPEGEVVLSGWGSTSRTQFPIMPDILHTVNLPIIPYEECQEAIDAIEEGTPFDETMVCTGPLTGGYGACSGDSGGPLVLGSGDNRTIVGIVSWGFIPCGGNGAPSVFTKVSNFLDFINDNTQ